MNISKEISEGVCKIVETVDFAPAKFKINSSDCLILLARIILKAHETVMRGNKRGYNVKKKITNAFKQMLSDSYEFEEILEFYKNIDKPIEEYGVLIRWCDAILPVEYVIVKDFDSLEKKFREKYKDDLLQLEYFQQFREDYVKCPFPEDYYLQNK